MPSTPSMEANLTEPLPSWPGLIRPSTWRRLIVKLTNACAAPRLHFDVMSTLMVGSSPGHDAFGRPLYPYASTSSNRPTPGRRGAVSGKPYSNVGKIRNLCYKLRAAGINPSHSAARNGLPLKTCKIECGREKFFIPIGRNRACKREHLYSFLRTRPQLYDCNE